jgi:HD-GYP domain-containing protein (c-di-GMP phosphodiesterase class II)
VSTEVCANEKHLSGQIRQVIRITCVVLVAIAVVASAMAMKGWQMASFLLAGIIVLLGGLLVMQVCRALRSLRRHSSEIHESARDAQEHYVGVLRRIVKFVEARDKYTRGRSDRIGKLAELISRRMGLSQEKCSLLNIAGQLHDIGLLAVPEGILNKRSSLGADEFRTVQRHSEVSYEVLKPLSMFADMLPAIRYHHERMNGTGYPSGLAGDQIPAEARILAVADAYDAMTHDRPHRPAMSPLDAMKELRRCTPAGYDKACVDALAEIVNLTDLEAAMRTVDRESSELEPANA